MVRTISCGNPGITDNPARRAWRSCDFRSEIREKEHGEAPCRRSCETPRRDFAAACSGIDTEWTIARWRRSAPLPQLPGQNADLALDRLSGVEAHVLAIGVSRRSGHRPASLLQADRHHGGRQPQHVHRRNEAQVAPEQLLDALIPTEIGVDLRRLAHRGRHQQLAEYCSRKVIQALIWPDRRGDRLHVAGLVQLICQRDEAVKRLLEVGAAHRQHLVRAATRGSRS